MQEKEILDLWRSYNEKLDASLYLNQRNAQEITRLKIRSVMGEMKPVKIFAIMAGILWVGFIDNLVISLFHIANPFFLISAGLQALLTTLAIGVYLYQLVLIHQADISEPVVETQARLAGLRSSTLWVARLLFLQLPLWTTFYWNGGMLQNGNLTLLIIQGMVTAAFTFAAVWLFINIRFQNRHKKWFKLIFKGKEWEPMMKAMEMLDQVKDYQAKA